MPGDQASIEIERPLRAAEPPRPAGLSRQLGLQMLLQAVGVADQRALHIGRFVVIERLGQGGMGSVYRAHDPELDREVAIKVLDRQLDERNTQAMIREARALARLTHPNVVRVYDLDVTQGQVYVAMEYVPGMTLRERCAHGRNASWQEVVRLFVQAGQGLQAAHDAGVVHRDFKPDNVLVHNDGRVLVADFGLARIQETGAEEPEIAGTLDYMAPEVVGGDPATPASDQYGFCASLWRMLDPVSRLGSTGSPIDAGLREVLARGLAARPDQRWPSVAHLLVALEQTVQEGPEDRQRGILLDRVERLWITGVLRQSLNDEEALVLPCVDASDRVARPWASMMPSSDSAPRDARDLGQQLELGNGSLLVLGEPGAGKTTALLMLAEELVERARTDRLAPAPVVLNLFSMARFRGSLQEWIEQELLTKYSLPRPRVRRWIESDALIVLLDGLDEVAPERRRHCIRAINAFRAEHPIPTVVTCRTSDYDAIGERLALGAAVLVEPLPRQLIEERLVGSSVSTTNLPRALASPERGEQLRTPLMLGLVTRNRETLPEGDVQLSWLYDRYVDQAFASRSVPPAEREATLAGLRWLAATMTRLGATELWIEQLGVDWLAHAWQRWLAWGVGLLLVLSVCLGTSLGGAVIAGRELASGLILGLLTVPVVIVFNRGLRIRPVERLQWSARKAIQMAPLSIGLGVTVGAIYGSFYVLWINLIYGAVAGMVAMVTLALEPADQESRVRPNQGIKQSIINALGTGAVGFILGGVALGYVVTPLALPHLDETSAIIHLENPTLSVFASAGSVMALIIGMVHGGIAVLMHVAVRTVLVLTTPFPLRLIPFLERAVDLALMRRIGGGYIFLHRTFQDFLAGVVVDEA